jgi:membrane-bound lytic murein transglycosylase D
MIKFRAAITGFVILSAVSVGVSRGADSDATPEISPTVTEAGSSPADAFQPSNSKEADDCLRRADRHFNAGRQFYFQGDSANARHEFDEAVGALLAAPEGIAGHSRIQRRLEEICDLIYRFDVEKLGAGQKATEEQAEAFDKAPIDEISHMTFQVDPSLAPKLASELNQTSSGIPLDLSDQVLGFVHYFSTPRGRNTLIAGLRRSGRYRPLIEKIFAEEGVPQELVYLAQAESGFLPRAVSYKKAVGMWQFIADTGSIYELQRTASYDERFDPEKATRAAARLLKDLHNRYNDWYLAIAAYNCGAGAVDRAVERTGYADYWELLKRHALPRETANYVPIIVAMTIMGKNPKDYGLEDVVPDAAIEYDSIHLTAPTNLNLVADATLQPVSVIRDLNPALLTGVAPAGYEAHVPKGSGEDARAALESVPAGNRQAWRLHHVEAGDTLATIARSYHLNPERIVAVNSQADSIEAGDTLLIPAVYHPEATKRTVHSRARLTHARATTAKAKTRSSKTASAHRSTHVAASRHVAARVLHRPAAVHTASLAR